MAFLLFRVLVCFGGLGWGFQGKGGVGGLRVRALVDSRFLMDLGLLRHVGRLWWSVGFSVEG